VTAEVLRYFLLATHYRSPLDFSDAGLADAKRALDNLYDLFLRLEEQTGESGRGDRMVIAAIDRFKAGFHQALDDDLNTPVALAEFQRLRTELNKGIEAGLSKSVAREAHQLYGTHGRILGLFQMRTRDWQFARLEAGESLSIGIGEAADVTTLVSDTEIELRLKERRDARQRKDFKRADEIRQSLLQQGITIEDRPDGTSRWKR
jgi:cysteinyl-tRNA synthetase